MSKFTNAGKIATIGLWIARILLAAFFLSAAMSKLAGAERQILLFNAIGWGQWFRYFTAAVEIMSAIALIIPATGALGALGIFVTSIGAAATLVALGKPIVPAAVTLVWSGALLWALRGQFPRLIAALGSGPRA